MNLTDKQKEIFEFLVGFFRKRGISPTIEEIQQRFKLASKATVIKHLTALERKRLIERPRYQERGIKMLQDELPTPGMVKLPVLGSISAGSPIEQFPLRKQKKIPVQEKMVRGRNPYLLLVSGDSMMDAGILNGDYISIEDSQVARNGDTVIALIDGCENTVKVFYKEKGFVRLEPRNKAYKPIIIRPPRTVEIQGIVRGSFRYY